MIANVELDVLVGTRVSLLDVIKTASSPKVVAAPVVVKVKPTRYHPFG